MVNSAFFDTEEKQNAVTRDRSHRGGDSRAASGISSQDENLNLDHSGGGLWMCPSNRDWNLWLKEGHVKAFT